MAFRTGTYNEFHFQTVVRTRIRKPEKQELLDERYHDLREDRLVMESARACRYYSSKQVQKAC